MTLFLSTLNQMGFLLFLMAAGFVLVKLKVMPDSATQVLSKLENNLFIPALVMGTFMTKFTPDSVSTSGVYLLCGLAVVAVTLPIAVLVAKCFSRDSYLRKIYTYGLAFSNFGFMGNAVVSALFPDIFMEYLIFTLPLWTLIYLWGVPALLIPGKEGEKKSLLSSLKRLVNPMFAAMLVGMILGLTGVPLPDFVGAGLDSLGGCMSPVAMLLTGMTVSSLDLKKTFTDKSVYLASFIRLLAFPAAFMALLWVLPLPGDISLCVLCAVAMPLGLSPVVIPAAYGQDTSAAAGMALISHLLSVATIPLIFWVYSLIG